MIITSEHDFSSANTYIHLGYALAQNQNVATHEDKMACDHAGDCRWGSGGGVCSHRQVMSPCLTQMDFIKHYDPLSHHNVTKSYSLQGKQN